MRFLLGQAFVLLFCSAAVATERVPNVVGGSDASLSDAPWQAFVAIDNKFCGGVIISPRWVLTAAHCLDSASNDDDFVLASANSVSVYTGTAQINGADFSDYLTEVDSIYVNSTYSKETFSNDIALIKLAEDVHPDAMAVQLADLAVQSDVDATANLSNNDLRLTGWGFINSNRTGSTNTLQKAMLSAVSDDSCAAAWGTLLTEVNDYQNTYFCAFAPSKGACNGDSGGPLVWFDPSRAADADGGARLVGLVSFGVDSQCASPSFPDVYTQVSNYLSWINSCIVDNCVSESSNVTVVTRPPAPAGSSSGGGAVSIFWLLFTVAIRWAPRCVGMNVANKRTW